LVNLKVNDMNVDAQVTVVKRIPVRNETETLELKNKIRSNENVTVCDFSNFENKILRNSAKLNDINEIKHVVSNTFNSRV
jgi:hypothetical protein